MSVPPQLHELKRLVHLLAKGAPVKCGAIPWAPPVMAFGSLQSRVATLGLNPSNVEFEDANGAQLYAPLNRFETLASLGVKSWANAGHGELQRIWRACELYFTRRPYHRWFKPLDKVIAGMGVSYYDSFSSACHLDLVPFATAAKWSALAAPVRDDLLAMGAATLVQMLQLSEVQVLILNGATVVREFQKVVSTELTRKEMPGWQLSRGKLKSVSGYGYVGTVSSISGVELGRGVLVLGFNHNIQSTYGMSTAVVDEIRQWITLSAKEKLP